MAIFSASRGLRRPLLIGRVAARLATAVPTPSSTSSPPPHLSPSTTKPHLHKVHDPNKTLPIPSSAPKPSSSSSSTSGRFAVEIAARRLACVKSRESNPAASQESFLSTVILSYGSVHMLDRAIAIFEQIPRLCSAPATTLSFNALLSSAIRAGEHSQVPDLFSLLSQQNSISPDQLSYGILVKALCLSGKLESALAAIKEMEAKGVEVTTVIYTTIINFLYREGKPERAEELWKEMIEKGRVPDLTSYNVKIMHGALDGKLEEVLETISEMRAAGLKPDRITYNYLMTCYSKKGTYEDVKQVYEELKSSGCAPNSTTFRIMLNLLCKNGDFDAGFEVFKDSMKRDKIPDFVTVRGLVVGLAERSRLEEAKMVMKVMRERFAGGWKVVEEGIGLGADGQASVLINPAES